MTQSQMDGQPGAESSIESLLNEKTGERVALNLLRQNVTIYNAVDSLAVLTHEPKFFPASGVVKLKFAIGERNDGFRAYPSTGGLGEPIMNQLRGKGFDIVPDAINFVVTLSVDKFRELAEADTSRGAIAVTLGQ